MGATNYPLQWPDGWKRTLAAHRQSAPYKMEPSRVLEHLTGELRRFRATNVVISSCLPVRRDGLPYTDKSQPIDVGVAVYWSTNKFKERVIACDKWVKVWDNMHALGLAIEALRAVERSGATQVLERAFTAFGALPEASSAPKVKPWWEVLGLQEGALQFVDAAMCDAKYRDLARKAHPDSGGSEAAMAELNRARVDMRKHYGVGA